MTESHNVAEPADVMSAALEYANRGWYVFPVVGKRPDFAKIGAWSDESSVDPEQIVAWLAGRSGVGIAVDLARSGLAVIDGDHIERMPDVLRQALDNVGAWRHQGQRDRCSWLFTVAEPPPQAAHPWGEVKAAGGYIVLAPSPHPDQEEPYRWIDRPGAAPPPLPEAIRQAVARREAPTETATPWQGGTPTSAEVAEARALLARQASALADMEVGSRNNMLNRAAFIAGRYAPHYLTREEIVEALTAACKTNGLLAADGQNAVRDTIRSGLNAGGRTPADLTLDVDPLAGLRKPDVPDPCPPIDRATGEMHTVDDLWEATPVMRHIHQAALARNRSPVATLVGCLVLATTAAGPRYVLPPVVGGVGSLNLMAMFAGNAGAGKSSTVKMVRELMPTADAIVHHGGAGTGEGLAQMFLSRKPDGAGDRAQVRLSAFLYVDEYLQMQELSGRNGNTFMSTMRSMAMGEQIDTTNAETLRHLDALSYRMGMIVGIQPRLAEELLDDKAISAGTPQRFLWVNVQRPNPESPPEWPGALQFDVPEVDKASDALTGLVTPPAHENVEYPDDVKAYVRAMDRIAEDMLDTEQHSVLNRLKIAAALAMLHDEWNRFDHWHWLAAGVLLEHSRETREAAVGTVRAQRAKANAAQGIAHAERAVVVEDRLEDHRLGRVRTNLLKRMVAHAGEWQTKSMLKSSIRAKGGGRELMEAALDSLVADGLVETQPGRKGGEWRVTP